MSFMFAHIDECETAGNWQLVRRTLGLRAFGVNAVEIPPGEQIPEHDETDRDQEELFYVLAATRRFSSTARSIRHALGPSRGSTPSTRAPSATTAVSPRAC